MVAKKSKKVMKKPAKKVMKKNKNNNKTKKLASKKVQALAPGYNYITPCLTVKNAKEAIKFYTNIFGGKVKMLMEHNNRVMHCEIKFGDTKIMLADEFPDMGAHSPEKFGGSPVGIHLYVKNVDQVADYAVKAGATMLKPLENMFYGDRSCLLQDPFGHKWFVATHVENVTPAQTRKRAAALFSAK